MNRKRTFLFFGTLTAFVAVAFVFLIIRTPSYDFEKTKAEVLSSDFVLLSRSGEPISLLRKNLKKRNLGWIELRDISPSLIPLLLKSEDKNFYSHLGVDYKALGASVFQRAFLSSPRGGSTITMQMAKLLSSKNDLYSGQFGKIRQIIFAHKLETSWSKDEILEAYLNLTYFRGELQGLRAASLGLFHKEPVGLNDSESAILSALIRSPQAEPQRVSERACLLLGVTTCGDIQDLARTLENKYSVPQGANWASHLTRILIKENPEATFMQSTLDSELQKMVIGVVTEQISQLTQRNVEDAAVLVIHNKTGEVRAYVGSTGPLSKSSQVDGVRSLRQAGSTLKPFLYGLAFENRIIEPDSWIEDSAVEIVFKNGVYRPQNHDKNFRGWVKVHQALAASLNTPAVRVYQMLGEDQVFDTFKSLDFVLKEPEYYGSAFALGVADVSLWSLTNAYRTFANHGIYSELTLTPRQEDEALKKESVFSEETAKKINKILSSNTSRAITFGLDSPLSTPFPSAVKTGTSKDMRDNWCLGYTEDYTVGVWVGNFNGEPMWNVLGVTGAGPIWQRVITWLHENRKEGTRHLAAEDAEGENASEVKTTPQQYPGARILYPPSGMIMAIDREIPAKNQKVPLLAEVPNHRRYHWQIGDKKLAVNSQDTLWTPIPGRHQIDLFVEGKLVESAEVIVK